MRKTESLITVKRARPWKKRCSKHFDKKAPSTGDIEIQSRHYVLKDNPAPFNYNNNNNNNLPPPLPPSHFQPPPPPFRPPQPLTFRASPPTFRHFNLKPPPVQNNFNFSKTKTILTATPFGELAVDKTLGDSKKQDNLQRQIDDVFSEIPELPKLELSDSLLNILSTEGDDILKLNM